MCYSANATHIVGGSMSHFALGNNQYIITVEIFRDCYNGEPYFDDPLNIAVYSENNVLVGEYYFPLTTSTIDTVSILPSNFVCVFPQGVCIEKALYYEVIELPADLGKYTVVHQRCCRSQILSNLVAPLDIGMTFFTEIDNTISNSSPIFNQDIPVAIFEGVPFIYDGGATDPDGDSLTYSLSTPFLGADALNPKPLPPLSPPYQTATFIDPPYSQSNMLGGNYPLVIDAETGEFSAIPTMLGAYQIAYKVDEYRNGQLIGTTYRDFIFVVVLPEPATNFDVSGKVLVDSLTPLDAGVIQLLKRDITNDSLYLMETYQVSNGGYYAFENIPPGVFYLRAIPDSSSAYFGNYLPTYYRSNLFWYDAITVNQCDTAQFYRDILLVGVDSFNNGTVYELKGTVNNSENFEVVKHLPLLLADSDSNFVAYTETNEFGFFHFFVPSGQYYVYADLWNSTLVNSSPPSIPVEAGQTMYASLLMYPNYLSFEGFTASEEAAAKGNLLIIPNPSDGRFSVQIPEGANLLNVWNTNGTKVLTRHLTYNEGSLQIDLPTGFYFIGVNTGQGTWIGKMFIR
jgi:hypothetical protein